MAGSLVQQDSNTLSQTSASHPTLKSCIFCISLLVHTTHTHSLLAMDFITSILFPVSPATEDYEDPVDREGSGSSNPYGFCVVA